MTKLKPTIEFEYPTEARGPIPSFNNIEEEAEWWDTHDAEGYPVEFDLVEQGENWNDLDQLLTVPLDEGDRADLTKYAKRKGIGPSTLARIWIKEHLEEEAAREAKAS